MPTILLVEDEHILRDICTQILKKVDTCDVLRASNGNQALQIADEHGGRIDLLLSDIIMDGGPNGIELAERVSGSRPETKVLLMSGGFNNEDSLVKHGWHFIAKPFLPSALRHKIEELLVQP